MDGITSFSASGISIGIVTHNLFFYNRLALRNIRKYTRLVDYEILVLDNGSTDESTEWLMQQHDVRLFRRPDNDIPHGLALDLLVQQARFRVFCSLCGDAFPVSPEWLTPAFHVDDQTVLAGIDRGWGRQIDHYVCPSYLFGHTAWLAKHSFLHDWPTLDTGERLGIQATEEGKKMAFWQSSCPDWGGRFKSNKPCDYNGWVWHTWWGVRSRVIPQLEGNEFESGYHEYVIEMLREKHGLDF